MSFSRAVRAGAMASALLFAGALVLPGEDAKLSTSDLAILKSVDAHYNRLHSLRTQFAETYDGLGLHKAEAGTLLLSKPGRMRWTYATPQGKVFVLNGKFAWSYAPGDAQAQRIPARQFDDLRSPLRLLLGHTQLQRELSAIKVMPRTGGFLITGVPRGQQARLAELSVDVDASGQIQRLRLAEVDGATTSFSFTGTQENPVLRSEDFLFKAPDGVPVVDGLAPL